MVMVNDVVVIQLNGILLQALFETYASLWPNVGKGIIIKGVS